MKLRRGIGLVALVLSVAGVSLAKDAAKDAARVTVTIDGQTGAFVTKVSGGMATKGNKASIEIDRNGAEPLWSWVKASLEKKPTTKNLVLPLAPGKATAFSDALITEVGFPALDRAAKQEVGLTFTVLAKKTAPASSGQLKGSFKAEVQKRWLPANFRLSLGDLPCDGVSKIDSIAIKQKTTEDGTIERVVTPVRVTFDSAAAAAWLAWHKTKKPMSGSVALTEDDGSVWQTIQLDGVAPKSVKTTGPTTVAVLAVKSLTLK